MIESCHTCRFWSLTTFTLIGQCRRKSPSHLLPQYPETPMQHWCGEYEAIEYRRKEMLDCLEVPVEGLVRKSYTLQEHGEVNASVQSQSEEVAGVGSVDLRNKQSGSERDCGTTDSAEPELLQAEASNVDDRAGGAGVRDIENKCQDCLKTFMINFECAVCNDCYFKRQGRTRHYMG